MNPELRRLLLIEFQGYRLVILPTVLAGVFGLAYFLNDYRFDAGTSFLATAGFFALVFIWGTRQAAECVLQEINNKTWVPQRMSSLSAWSMTWAKLAGSTAFTWLGGAVCLGVYAASNAEWWDTRRIVTSVALYAATGILAQTVCFLISLSAIQRRREFGRVHVVSYQFLGMLCALPPLYIGLSATGGEGILDVINWHGQYLGLPQFMAIFTGAFTLWGLIGVWALMRAELQEPLGPWLWIAFTAFTMAFFGGLRSLPVGPNTPIAFYDFPSIPTVVAMIGVLLIYVAGLTESKNRIRLRRLHGAVQARQWPAALLRVPRAAVTIVIVGLGVWIAAANFSDYTEVRGRDLHLMYAALLIFACRDMLIMYFVCLGRRDGRGEGLTLMVLIVVYILVPETVGIEMLDLLIPVFSPFGENPTWWTIAAPALETAGAGWLVAHRWRKTVGAHRNTAAPAAPVSNAADA